MKSNKFHEYNLTVRGFRGIMLMVCTEEWIGLSGSPCEVQSNWLLGQEALGNKIVLMKMVM